MSNFSYIEQLKSLLNASIGERPIIPDVAHKISIWPVWPPCSDWPTTSLSLLCLQLAAACIYWVVFFWRSQFWIVARMWLREWSRYHRQLAANQPVRRPPRLLPQFFGGIALPIILAVAVAMGSDGVHAHVVCNPTNKTDYAAEVHQGLRVILANTSFDGRLAVNILEAIRELRGRIQPTVHTSCEELAKIGRDRTPYDKIIETNVIKRALAFGKDLMMYEWSIITIPFRCVSLVLIALLHYLRNFWIILRAIWYFLKAAVLGMMAMLLCARLARCIQTLLSQPCPVRSVIDLVMDLWSRLCQVLELMFDLCRFLLIFFAEIVRACAVLPGDMAMQIWDWLKGVLGPFAVWLYTSILCTSAFFGCVHLMPDVISEVFCIMTPLWIFVSVKTSKRQIFLHILLMVFLGLPLLYAVVMYILKAAVYFGIFPVLELLGMYHMNLNVAFCLTIPPHYGTIPITNHTIVPAVGYSLYQFMSTIFARWRDPGDPALAGFTTVQQAWLLGQAYSSVFAIRAALQIPAVAPFWFGPLWYAWISVNVSNILLNHFGSIHFERAQCIQIVVTLVMVAMKIGLPFLLTSDGAYGSMNEFMVLSIVLSVLSCGESIAQLRHHPDPPRFLRDIIEMVPV